MKTYEVVAGRIFGKGPGETFKRKLDKAQERRLVERGNIRVKRKKTTGGNSTVETKDTPTGGSTNQSKED